MLRTSASSRTLRICVLGLATITAAVISTTDTADARRRHRHHHRHHAVQQSYNPAFASIIVDANSGATLTATNADGLRFPASLTKIMTLYLLFERLDAGKVSLNSEMPVSAHAASQAPTKLGLRPGQTIRVEDAIKGLVTRSANDAAVVIAEFLGGDEDDFAKMMTRKARALGMTRTVYRNASGLPNDDQVTTARDQSTLGRAIQDRFPRYYRYFATASFNYRGRNIRNHNHLLGKVEGVDGIKTGYTRASGFNLVTNLRRGNRHLVGVVMGGRSYSSRDAIMRNLLAENLDKASGRRTIAAIAERNSSEANAAVAEEAAQSRPAAPIQVQGAIQVAAVETPPPLPPTRAIAAAPAPKAPAEAAPAEPAPLTNGVIQSKTLATIPGSTEPMKPVRIKTVQVRSGQVKVASAGPTPLGSMSNDATDISGSVGARDLPVQPPNHGTGKGLLGVLPASAVTSPAERSVQQAAVDTSSRSAPQMVQANGAIKSAAIHSGWIVQVGALESESQARQRLEAARDHAKGMLGKADPFTETVVTRGDKKLYRARFAGLERDQAEAVCKRLKRSDISCITIRN
ncbi:MAG: D-alanyl-D-alanine carboxypeptidase [Rhizobiales bacterium]|nr:D-alanyl-D-alanine carboxypeptidase [Hyphomicrobiales bacterium]